VAPRQLPHLGGDAGKEQVRDALALEIGLQPCSIERALAGLVHQLLSGQGHELVDDPVAF
jgi:hypothetical protein